MLPKNLCNCILPCINSAQVSQTPNFLQSLCIYYKRLFAFCVSFYTYYILKMLRHDIENLKVCKILHIQNNKISVSTRYLRDISFFIVSFCIQRFTCGFFNYCILFLIYILFIILFIIIITIYHHYYHYILIMQCENVVIVHCLHFI